MIVEGVERFALLEGLTPEESDAIVRRSTVTSVKKGAKVFEAGEDASALFLVRSGKIELRFKMEYLNGLLEVPLETIEEGGVCGWSAMIPTHTYTLTARATEDAVLLRIHKTDLRNLGETNPRLGYIVMKNVARIIGERYELFHRMLIGEIQRDLKRKQSKALWKDE